MKAVTSGKIARKKRATKGRQDIYVQLGGNTIDRYRTHYKDGDYAAIAAMVNNPPTTRATVMALLKAAEKNIETKVPSRIAKATQDFYLLKEKTQNELNK